MRWLDSGVITLNFGRYRRVTRKSPVNSPRDTLTGISPSLPISRISEPDLVSLSVKSSMRSAIRSVEAVLKQGLFCNGAGILV